MPIWRRKVLGVFTSANFWGSLQRKLLQAEEALPLEGSHEVKLLLFVD
jgi:hypothetical protein